MGEHEDWRPAYTQWGDWRGTISTDAMGGARIDELAPDGWVVVGVELSSGQRRDGTGRPRLIEADQVHSAGAEVSILAMPEAERKRIGAIVDGQRVEVTRFFVKGQDAWEILRAMDHGRFT